MSTAFADTTWAALVAMATDGPIPILDPTTLDDLPPPAQRLLRRALPAGTPLSRAVVLTMTGRIKLGPAWMPFAADQILLAGVGLVWAPTVGGRLIRFTGADVLGPDGARIEFRLHGRLPVVRGTGPDITRSAAGRLAAETVAWLPQALTPQAGARWSEIDEEKATVTVDAAGQAIPVEVAVDGEGRLTALALQRWNSSARPPGPADFGGSVGASYTVDNGVTIAGDGMVGWDWGTPNQAEGVFFHYTITSVRFLADSDSNSNTATDTATHTATHTAIHTEANTDTATETDPGAGGDRR